MLKLLGRSVMLIVKFFERHHHEWEDISITKRAYYSRAYTSPEHARKHGGDVETSAVVIQKCKSCGEQRCFESRNGKRKVEDLTAFRTQFFVDTGHYPYLIEDKPQKPKSDKI